MFIDSATIHIKAGKGGDGSVSFHREKFVIAGGPDGGDGGRGGHVYLQTDGHMNTLTHYRHQRRFQAEDGADGQRRERSGKSGGDLTLFVPKGTLVRNAATGALIKDMSDDEPFLICKGGRGGWGNRHFANPTRQAPRFAKSGLDGEACELTLELKLLADVGLVGFPNVGKSMLLSVVSAARPKVANYHFTTLSPMLGVVQVGMDDAFVCADIPGLIEGASAGVGLGHDFLRHIDRCRLLVHLIDISGSEGRDFCADFDGIMAELKAFNPDLATRPQIVAANKCDLLPSEELEAALERLKEHIAPCALFPISAATTAGVDNLRDAIAAALAALPPITIYEPDPEVIGEEENSFDLSVKRHEDGGFILGGAWLERLVRNVNFDDYESRSFFDRKLKESGAYDRLEAMGVEEGDTIRLVGMEFDYVR